MADYKRMYIELLSATEDAIQRLIAAQRACEDIYINDDEPSLIVFPPKEDD